jgi:hypothetical protein
MYGFEFNIAGNAAKELKGMFGYIKDIQQQAMGMQKQFDTIKVPTVANMPTIKIGATTYNETATNRNESGVTPQNSKAPINPFGDIQNSVRDIQKMTQGVIEVKAATENMNKPFAKVQETISAIRQATGSLGNATKTVFEGVPQIKEQWQGISDAVIDARKAFATGDFEGFKTMTEGAINEAFNMANNIRTQFGAVIDYTKTAFGQLGQIPFFAKIGGGIMTVINGVRGIGVSIVQTIPSMVMFAGRGILSMGAYAASLMGATGAQMALNVAMSANPIGVMIAGVTGIGVAVVGLISYWDTVKQWLTGFGEFFIKNHPFRWVFDIINTVFPNLSQSIQNTFGKAWQWINDNFLQPIKDMFGWVMDKAKWLVGEVAKPFTIDINANVPKDMGIETDFFKSMKTANGISDVAKNMGIGKNDKHTSLGIDKKNKDITGEKREIKNINITIHKMIDKVEFVVNKNIDTSLQEFKDKLQAVLMDGVNQANYA